MAVPRNPPSAAAPIISPSATLSGTVPKCTVRSKNARKKIMNPENARSAALAPIASLTIGPRLGNCHQRRLGRASGTVPRGPRAAGPCLSGPLVPGPCRSRP